MEELVTSIFKITSTTPYDKKTKFYRMECPSWVNIFAITQDKKVILVKQYRYGINEVTLELPAGKMDIDDQEPIDTAKRELLEETGYGNGQWHSLGWIHPNPAIQNNRCYQFLAYDVEKLEPIKNDIHEQTEPVYVDVADIDRWVLEGKITHSLAISTIYLYQKWHLSGKK